MAGADRRDILRWVGASAIATLAGFASAPAIAAPNRQVSVPGGCLLLTRRVTRELDPRTAIIVTREWQIGFAGIANGWLVSGDMVAAKVDAPPPLGTLAEIEQRRAVPESFPIELDANGLIRRTLAPQLSSQFEAAALEAQRMLAANDPGGSKQRDLRGFVAQLQLSASSLIARFPQDLFFPVEGTSSETREMSLPGGAVGRFRMDYSAIRQPGSMLLRSSTRTVTTSAGAETMRSIEEWNLLPV